METAPIGAAIATLFDDLTPPTGHTDIQSATSKRQTGAGKLPMVVVSWTGTRDFVIGFKERTGTVDYVATFYYSKQADNAATDDALQAWSDVLADALLGQIQLGEWAAPNGVNNALMTSVTPGIGQLGGESYAVLEMPIEVTFWHQVSSVSA